MFMRLMQNVTVVMVIGVLAGPAAAGTILQYHQVADRAPASTSVTVAQFSDHLARLDEEGFRVVRLDALLALARQGQDTANLVAITFDDGFASLLEQAIPLLDQRGWPAAVFVTTSQVGGESMLDVAQLRELAAAGHLVLNHGHEHVHAVRARPGETGPARLERLRQDLLRAQSQLESWLPEPPPRILAWPYGEHDAAARGVARELGFTALAQLTGAVGPQTDWQQVPRIAVNRRYADWASLRDKLRARPMAAQVIRPEDGVTRSSRPMLVVHFPEGPGRLQCFLDGQPLEPMSALPQRGGHWRWQLTPGDRLEPGRHRINCTRPASAGGYEWFAWLWMVRDGDDWYPEY